MEADKAFFSELDSKSFERALESINKSHTTGRENYPKLENSIGCAVVIYRVMREKGSMM